MYRRVTITIVLLLLAHSASLAAQGSPRTGGPSRSVALGVILGEPTGLSFKGWLSSKSALDAAVAWSFERHARFHIHGDYLLHSFSLIEVDEGRLPFYYGIGGRIILREDDYDDLIGVRFPLGLEYLFEDLPLDLFFEMVPVLDLAPDTDVDFEGAIGIRYIF